MIKQRQIFSLNCRQFCHPTPDRSPKEPWVIPIAFKLITQNGETVLIFNQAEQLFSFDNIQHPPIPSLLRHFSAPVKLSYPYSNEQLMTLVAQDDDLFNRWDACTQLFIRCIKQQASIETLIQALSCVLSDSLTAQLQDKAFVAELLALPSFAYLVEDLNEAGSAKPIDIAALLEHRRDLISQIAHKLSPILIEIYQQSNEDEDGRTST